ncbi:3-dehydroquinate synthase [Candidatus Viadribacter manganicus]|uniref:3-dehydroquinate synthase n=1 Tax=Candidatus Viadribacter manganicus TaxID=1759059 RepID=A0A1B1AG50_9PROT|nr:3-dehydroquinate synthase [Candidatus Viadribacter manganicus]ANP45515.1 3-dehydroquinate synthase [Candidatus Viadribacter manganicus]
MNTIHVKLGERSYDVLTGANLLSRAGELIAPYAPSNRVFIIADETVARLHRPALAASLDSAGLKNWTITLPPGESAKSFTGLEMVTRHLLQAGVSRKDIVIAFGGGVIGDLSGLAAGLVKRGVDFVQIPTTLLAQVDSSVGGKTAIDTPEGKNLVGLIHQPKLVIADLDVLTTLDDRQLRAGYAEIVKAALIGDAAFFDWCDAHLADLLAGKPDALQHAIATAIAFKARIVESDETEQGVRALLNLGHTFAHALEAHAAYDGALLHGEAVAAGANLAFQLSAQLGHCSAADAVRVKAHLERAGFITDLRELPGAPYDAHKLTALMAADKKNEAGLLTLILARGVGRAFIDRDAPADVVLELLQQETQ